MKTITYTASTELGARSMAYQDGHTGEPLQVWRDSEGVTLKYQARSRLTALWELRCAKARRYLQGIAHRRTVDQQAAILRALR